MPGLLSNVSPDASTIPGTNLLDGENLSPYFENLLYAQIYAKH